MRHDPSPRPGLEVLAAEQLRAVRGANLGDGVGPAHDLVPDDVYRLTGAAAPRRLALDLGTAPPFRVAAGGTAGRPGALLHFDCRLTFMTPEGDMAEALVLVETDPEGRVGEVHLHPLGALVPQRDYTLVGIDTETALQAFAEAACTSFARGTRITLASGAQRRIEDLRPGERVLTRDDGAQPIRWLGQRIMRAGGAFAPVVIRAGTLHNSGDLVVSPDHRLFVYQRRDRVGAGRAELMVRARHLVNGRSVIRRPGGYVEYHQMLFDRHCIVYAEGIAAESMRLDSRTRAVLPGELDAEAADLLARHGASGHDAFEVEERLLARDDAAELLRRSSLG
ncbi:Hint domain-containing protein [Roseivivax sp. CAU 1761]